MNKKFIFVVFFLITLSLRLSSQTSDKVFISEKIHAVKFTDYDSHNRGTDAGIIKTVLPNSGLNSIAGVAPQGSRKYIKACYLITPDEMAYSQFGINTVTSIGWTWIALSVQSVFTTGIIKAYMQNTTDSIYSKGTNYALALSGMTKITDGTISLPSTEGTYSIDVPAGGPGTSAFSTIAGNGVYVAFEYETIGLLALPLGSPTISCNDSLTNSAGFYNNQSVNLDVLTLTSLRPETRFGDSNPDTVEVVNIYSMGMTPIPWGFPDSVEIKIENNEPHGANELNVRSINQENMQIVFDTTFSLTPSLTLFSLRLPYMLYPQNDLVLVKAIPGDVIDHQLEYCHEITPDAYNYADPCKPNDGGLGFTATTGNIVAGFSNFSSQQFPIDAVDHCFINNIGNGLQQYQIIIYADNGAGKPGPVMYISPVLISPLGNNSYQKITHNLNTSVNIPPNSRFYVGYKQLQLINISACYQDEIPVRDKTFFYSTPNTSNLWIDFAHDSANYRLDISPRTCKNLKVKVYLEGFYNGAYMVKDKAVSEVRSFYSPYSIISRDTSYLDSNGTGYFNFPEVNKFSDYFFVIKHRNHIETWSHNLPERIDSCDNFYNFTDSLSKAYGYNMVHITILDKLNNVSGGYALFGGDVNQDGLVDASDLSIIDNDSFNFVTGYVSADANGDNIVDASDAVITENNSYNFISIITP